MESSGGGCGVGFPPYSVFRIAILGTASAVCGRLVEFCYLGTRTFRGKGQYKAGSELM